ncbi:MAG TPA: phosphoadenylyl-sulfate reductase [Bacillales bacterium]|nr:phosphoadenylyl-sulfate reductase [Bacillales bacterium]
MTYETWDEEAVGAIGGQWKDSVDVLDWSYREFGDDIVYACSFGAEGVVLTDLISQVRPDAEIVFLDTGLHFKETYELIENVKDRYPTLNIRLKKPNLSLAAQAEQYGDQLWKRDANLCCHLRKIKPLTEVLQGKKAWISGVRREQSPHREQLDFINKDDKFKLIKICPLIHWTWEGVWQYIRSRDLPYNELHDRGYPSIGCMPCTMPASYDRDLRSGRWAGMEKTECGLHQ